MVKQHKSMTRKENQINICPKSDSAMCMVNLILLSFLIKYWILFSIYKRWKYQFDIIKDFFQVTLHELPPFIFP